MTVLPSDSSAGHSATVDASAAVNPYHLIALSAYAAYANSLVGHPAPAVKEWFDWVIAPEVGDLVLENGAVYRPWDDAALGTLVRFDKAAPIMPEEQWRKPDTEDGGDGGTPAEAYTGDPGAPYSRCPTEDVWYVEPLNPEHWIDPSLGGPPTLPEHPRAVRWTNCMFIRVVTDRKQFR